MGEYRALFVVHSRRVGQQAVTGLIQLPATGTDKRQQLQRIVMVAVYAAGVLVTC